MATYLLAWNPNKWHWHNLAEQAKAVQAGARPVEQWSCGHTKRIEPGDKVFLIRLGKEPRGIMASGTVLSKPEPGVHWDEGKAAAGEQALRIQVQLETLLNPEAEPILPRERLKQ